MSPDEPAIMSTDEMVLVIEHAKDALIEKDAEIERLRNIIEAVLIAVKSYVIEKEEAREHN